MYQCPAPGHEDSTASLSVGQGDACALVYCQAGCSTKDDVLPVLGLTLRDLFDQARDRRAAQSFHVVAEYEYRNADGAVVFAKERREPRDFRIRRPNGRGGWIWSIGNAQRVLYRLPEVLAAIEGGRTVFLVEGERDADRIASLGLTATCNFDGAAKEGQSQKWLSAYGDMLKGADVVIIADRDEPGVAHARAALADLAGKARSAFIMQAAVVFKGADVTDHLNAGHDLRDLVPLPAETAAVAATEVRAHEPPDPERRESGERRLVLTPASEIAPEPVVWAWEDNGAGRIPAGSVGLFAGREGTGKSSFLIWLSARITRGELPGSFADRPRGVIYVAVEDSWKYTIVPRLIAAGADLTRVFRAEVEVLEGDTVSLSLPADNKLLEAAIGEHDVAMVALDPLLSAISDALDTHVNRQVRQALDPLARMADRTGAVVAGIAHFNKSTGTDASSLITASGAFKDVARYIFAFATDDEDGSQVISQTKNSLGRSDLPSLAYRLTEAVVPTAKGDARVGRLVLDGESARSVRDILSVQPGGADRDEKGRAEDFLRKALAGGPRRSKDMEEESREIHGISSRTLKRARNELRIPTAKRADGWWVSLPEHEGDLRNPDPEPVKGANSAKASSPGPVGTVGTLDPRAKVVHLWGAPGGSEPA